MLAVSGYLLLAEPTQAEDLSELLGHHWQIVDSLPCPGILPGEFFELEAEETTLEGTLTPGGTWLVSRLPLPEGNFDCRKIMHPTFIQEVL